MATNQPAPALPADPAPGAVALMLAGERLFGRHGIEGASIRQVTLAAGVGNNSAVAYHFGDREGLLRAISLWREPVITRERERLYAEAKAADTLGDVRTLMRLVAEPVLVIRDGDDGSHLHAAFVHQMLRAPAGRAIRTEIQPADGLVRRIIDHLAGLAAVFNGCPRDVLDFRISVASVAFYDAVVARDRMEPDDPLRQAIADEHFLPELYDMMAAICLRPAPRD